LVELLAGWKGELMAERMVGMKVESLVDVKVVQWVGRKAEKLVV
jgi:hypothetical protein